MTKTVTTVTDLGVRPPDIGAVPEEAQLLRRARMNDLIEAKCYGRSAIFSKISKINPSLVSQYRTGVRAITERTVGMIETAFALPGYFGQTPSESDALAAAVEAHEIEVFNTHLHEGNVLARQASSERGHVPQQFLDACEDLAVLLPEDAAVWVAQIKAAATKVRRANALTRGSAQGSVNGSAQEPGESPTKRSRAA